MQKYTAVIIDDEEDSRSNTRSMLQNYCPEIEVVGEAASGPEGKIKIQELKPHVVFLDINMPGMNGFQMLEGIYDRDFCVVFLTAYSEHGITAVKAGATDYLLKPLMLSELQGAIRKVVQHYESKPAVVSGKTETDKNIVLISHSKGFTLVDFKDIVWLEASDNYTNLFLNGQKKIVASKTLKEFEAILPTNDFFRIHRSALINVNYVKEYSNNEGGEVILSEGTHVQVSKARIQEFSEFIKTKSVSPK
ncbi:MAG: LytTR family DNA-binding domain-containing protein [Bacteroidota bacterium]|nr:LytTR family DNA-binding domain-containing protein [Bacteroidota bacterium]MDP3144303.1 LytTR family DNA-binding domain-containing protein [Bacteroidota bacterium]